MNDSKKKILMITEAFGGGVFVYLTTLCNVLVDYYNITLVYSDNRAETPVNYNDQFDKRINLIRAKYLGRKGILNISNNMNSIKELREIENQINPDVIHLHSSIAGALGRLAFKGKKIVYTPHGYSYLVGSTGIKSFVYKMVETILARNTYYTLAISKTEEDEAKRISKRTYCIENGINTDQIDSFITGVQTEQNHIFTVCTTGRITFQKQPEKYNEIAFSLPDIKFLWIGDGALRGKLTSPNIEVTGWLDRKEVLKLVYESDVFLLCSFGEGLSISLLEAMYLNKIVLVSNAAGNRDVIINAENGFICDSVKDYVSIINKIRDNYPQQIAGRAHQDIKKKYSLDVVKKKYVDFYSMVLT